MRTFYVQTLGCKVNQYESEQIASLLRDRGLMQTDSPHADVRIVNTCSVTIQAASKSRQTVRRLTRLPVLSNCSAADTLTFPQSRGRTIVTGCWATSDRSAAAALPGVDAVLTHHDNIAAELDRLLLQWGETHPPNASPPEPFGIDGSMIEAGTPAGCVSTDSKRGHPEGVKKIPGISTPGTVSLPLLGSHQTGRQRALLKIQDGCDAHCSYCIIPQLRPSLWSKPITDAVDEARRLVDAGHVEIVLTGIFLGAYGQPTALRRRQPPASAPPLAALIDALSTRVPGLRRLRFSSLEPGDLTPELIAVMRSHPQVVPHFHLPLQSGSDAILRRMNRQYRRAEFLRMVDSVREGFDRPAITTDIIVGFPGETVDEFAATLDVVDRAAFVQIHTFTFSPRPGTAAARWTRDFVRGSVVAERSRLLTARAAELGLAFRRSFLGESVEVLVEHSDDPTAPRHGRCERYFDVQFDGAQRSPGEAVRLRVEQVSEDRTWGRVM